MDRIERLPNVIEVKTAVELNAEGSV